MTVDLVTSTISMKYGCNVVFGGPEGLLTFRFNVDLTHTHTPLNHPKYRWFQVSNQHL